MYICICNGVTDSQIKDYVDQGARSVKDIHQQQCIADQCGKCACAAKKVIQEHISLARPA